MVVPKRTTSSLGRSVSLCSQTVRAVLRGPARTLLGTVRRDNLASTTYKAFALQLGSGSYDLSTCTWRQFEKAKTS